MKIAAITDDGQTISQHFGRAPYYVVVTVEDGKVVQHEQREKLGHSHFAVSRTRRTHPASRMVLTRPRMTGRARVYNVPMTRARPATAPHGWPRPSPIARPCCAAG